MAPVQTQTLPSSHPFSNPPTILSGRITKPPTTRSRHRAATASSSAASSISDHSATSSKSSPPSKSKPLLSYSPSIPTPNPLIPTSLLTAKLLLTSRPFVSSSLLNTAMSDGIYTRASHWLTPSSLHASRAGKSKRYFVLHTEDFALQPFGSAWEARVVSGGSRAIDAGNGVVIFVRERREWMGFMRGWKRGEKKYGRGELGIKGKVVLGKEGDGLGREKWRRKCGLEGEEGKGQGPMWVCVRAGMERIKRGEA